MKRLTLLACIAAAAALGQSKVDVYTPKEIRALGDALSQKQARFASKDLERYGNHYTMLAQREATGSSELHEHEADIFVIESGTAVIVTGGKLVNPRAQKPGEIRGSAIDGGERRLLESGAIIHIPAGVPHQLLVEDKPFTYFVIKVTGQTP